MNRQLNVSTAQVRVPVTKSLTRPGNRFTFRSQLRDCLFEQSVRRGQTMGSYSFVFNVILKFDNFERGQKAGREVTAYASDRQAPIISVTSD